MSSILKTTQMGQLGIRSVEKYAVDEHLKNALQQQLHEYDRIETEAHAICAERGWKVKELNPALLKTSEWMAHTRLAGKEKDDSGKYPGNDQKYEKPPPICPKG